MIIRTAAASDLPGLLRLYGQLNADDDMLSLEVAAERLERLSGFEGSAIYVGLAAGALVSSCVLIVVPNLTRMGRPYALVENVVTDAAHRRRGFGRRVVEAAIDAAWRHGCYKVMLLAGARDPGALRFYEGLGFAQSKTGFQIRRASTRLG